MTQINQNQKKKIPDTSGLVRKTDYNAKITEIEGKISISGLATNAALSAVENKMPNISSLVKTAHYDTKITKTEKKLLVMTMINVLLLQNLISFQQKFLMQD